MGAPMAAAMLLRRLRTEIGNVLLLFLLLALTSFLAAAAPRQLNAVTDQAVRYSAANASAVSRDVWLNAVGQIRGRGSDVGGMAGIEEYGAARQAELPASIARLISGRQAGFGSARLEVAGTVAGIALTYRDGVTEASRIVAGRWPVDLGMPLDIGTGEQPPDPGRLTEFEIALSTATAEIINVGLGARLQVSLDNNDPMLSRQGCLSTILCNTRVLRIGPTELRVVGLFEPLNPHSDDFANTSLIQPGQRFGLAGVEAIYAAGYVAPEAYSSIYSPLMPFRYDWHYIVDPGRIDAGQVDGLMTDLRRLDLMAPVEDQRDLPEVGAHAVLARISIARGLLPILEDFTAQRVRSETVLSMAAVGPIGLALGAAAMLAIMLVRRRRDSLLLARGRGASSRLILGAQAIEAVALCGTAALVGLILAVYAVPARDAPLSPILALGVALAASVLLIAATWSTARRPLLTLERDDPPVLRVPRRRLIFEATIVAVCLLATYLLQQRGLGAVAAGGGAGFDPLLAAAPVLSGLAAGIIALRLYPIAVRIASWFAAQRRDLLPVVGLRTVARRPAAWNLPLLVLMLTAAFGTFASVIGSTVERGQVGASYLEVGADYRLERLGLGSLPTSIAPGNLPGTGAVATGFTFPTAFILNKDGTRGSTIQLNAIDAFAYAQVTAGTAAAPRWPASFLEVPPGAAAGTDENPIPAFASDQFVQATRLIAGDTFDASVVDQTLTFRLVGSRAGIPGLGGASFALTPLDWLNAALPQESLQPTVMWIRGSNELAAPLAEMVNAPATRVRTVSRQDVYQALRDAPLGTAVADGFSVALGVAALYMTVTLVAAVVISATRQNRDLAYLRTLGVSSRGILAVTLMEQVPLVLLGLVPGFLLGIAVANVVEPGLGLAVFIGASGLPLVVDWAVLAVVAASMTLVVVAAIGLGAWLAGRERLASALRMGDS